MAKKWWYFIAGWLLGGFFPIFALIGKVTGGVGRAAQAA